MKERARKILKQEESHSRIVSGNPVFLPRTDDAGLGAIIEEQDGGLLSPEKLSRRRHKSSVDDSYVSKVEPMIKQIQIKREKVTAKDQIKINDLQTKMAEYEKGHLTALQPDLQPLKMGKRITREPQEKNPDFLAHEGFDRVFERKYQVEFPDYNNLSYVESSR